jgi:hypothetical protein
MLSTQSRTDEHDRKLARESARQFESVIIRFIQEESKNPPDYFYPLLFELVALFAMMKHAGQSPRRTD